MDETIKSRRPTDSEKLVIDKIIKDTRSSSLITLVCFTILSLSFWIIIFNAEWIIAIMIFFIAILCSLISIASWITLKEISNKSDVLKIISGQGKWTYEHKGLGKGSHFVSKVNGKIITLISQKKISYPKIGEEKMITYEYVTILETPPPFGNTTFFISINGNKLIP